MEILAFMTPKKGEKEGGGKKKAGAGEGEKVLIQGGFHHVTL